MKINKFGIFLVFLMSFMILSGSVFATNQSQIPVVYKITGNIDLDDGDKNDHYKVSVTKGGSNVGESICYPDYDDLIDKINEGFFVGPLTSSTTGNDKTFNLTIELKSYNDLACTNSKSDLARVVISVPNPNVGSKDLIADTVKDGGINIDQLRASFPDADKVLAIDNSGDELTWINKSDVAPTYTAGDAITITGNVIDVKLLSIDNTRLTNNAVTTFKIVDGAVNTNKIANEAVTYQKLAAGGDPDTSNFVLGYDNTTSKFSLINKASLGGGGSTYTAGDAISISAANEISVEDEGITHEKLSKEIWDGLNLISSGAVNTENIRQSAVTSSKIALHAITASKIAPLAVNRERIANNAISTEKISNLAVTNSKIKNYTIHWTKLDLKETTLCPKDGASLIYDEATDKLTFDEWEACGEFMGCQPLTCDDVKNELFDCGVFDDGCGGIIECFKAGDNPLSGDRVCVPGSRGGPWSFGFYLDNDPHLVGYNTNTAQKGHYIQINDVSCLPVLNNSRYGAQAGRVGCRGGIGTNTFNVACPTAGGGSFLVNPTGIKYNTIGLTSSYYPFAISPVVNTNLYLDSLGVNYVNDVGICNDSGTPSGQNYCEEMCNVLCVDPNFIACATNCPDLCLIHHTR